MKILGKPVRKYAKSNTSPHGLGPILAFKRAIETNQHKMPFEVEIRYVRQSTKPAHYAWVWLNAEPSEKEEIVNSAGLESIFFEGLVKGLRSVLETDRSKSS